MLIPSPALQLILTRHLHPIQNRAQQSSTTSAPSKPIETDTLKLKKAWEIALAPSKQIPMNAIMMYMSGNSLQIFSIMMVFMLFKGPIQGLINTNTVFAKFDTEGTRGKLLGVKAIYVVMQLVLLCLGIWKVNAMGLLPYVISVSCSRLPHGNALGWILFIANTLRQDHKIGLAGLGVRTATVGACLFCFWMIEMTVQDECYVRCCVN